MTDSKSRDIRTIPLAIQCPACGALYMNERHTHKGLAAATWQYTVGAYGAIEKNLEWQKRQEASLHTWHRQYN